MYRHSLHQVEKVVRPSQLYIGNAYTNKTFSVQAQSLVLNGHKVSHYKNKKRHDRLCFISGIPNTRTNLIYIFIRSLKVLQERENKINLSTVSHHHVHTQIKQVYIIISTKQHHTQVFHPNTGVLWWGRAWVGVRWISLPSKPPTYQTRRSKGTLS